MYNLIIELKSFLVIKYHWSHDRVDMNEVGVGVVVNDDDDDN